MNNNFSINRTFNLCRLYFYENRKFLIICAIAVIGVLICLALAVANDVNYHNTYYIRNMDPALTTLVPMYIILGTVFAALGGSFMFAYLKSKQGRISTLMIPSLSSEKLVSRMMVYVIAYPIFFILAVCIAEFVRCSYVMAVNPQINIPVTPVYSIFSDPVALDFFTPNKHPLLAVLVIFFGVFTVQSFFILGSVLWPKYSSLKTFAVVFALFFINAMSVYYVGETVSKGLTYPTGPMRTINENIPYYFLAFEITACLFNWTMAWWRLKETDVITTKR